MRHLILFAALVLTGPAVADQVIRDADLLETCLAEEAHGQPDPCRGVVRSFCHQDRIACLMREADAWALVLSRHWPFRCGTCPGGYSLLPARRLQNARARRECPAGEEGDLLCLIDETARQATILFRGDW